MSRALVGLPGALAVAVGRAFVVGRRPPPRRARAASPETEWCRVEAAIAASARELEEARDHLARTAGPEAALFLEASILMHEDALLLEGVRRLVLEEGLTAEWAVFHTIDQVATQLAAAEGASFRERAGELHRVGESIRDQLLGRTVSLTSATAEAADAAVSDAADPVPWVLVAAELAPADAARLLRPEGLARIVAVATELGSPTSHTALLAGQLGVPAVLGVPGLLDALAACADDAELVVDGLHGEVVLAPSDEEAEAARRRGARFSAYLTHLADTQRGAVDADAPTLGVQTRDGVSIGVWANIDHLPEARATRALGAAGVGLYRTEYLYLRGGHADEETQLACYREILGALDGAPLVVRTFDLGAEKLGLELYGARAEGSRAGGSQAEGSQAEGSLAEAMPQPLRVGANPALGLRGVRLGLAHPEVLRTQLRAIARAAREVLDGSERGPVRVMFPMVNQLAELRAARALVREAALAQGLPADALPVGVMIETPAAALRAARFAAEADFLSVGSNDLTQYTLAADRGDPAVASLSDGLDPAVLELLRRCAQAGAAEEIRVTLCGSLASDPLAVPVLLGLGYRDLSVPVATLPLIRELVAGLELAPLVRLAEEACSLEDGAAVRAHVRASLGAQLGGLWREAGVEG